MNLPYFKYHADPIRNGVFKEYSGTCSCCGDKKGWKYIGPFYCTEEIENICPWCIKDGAAAEKFDLTFVDDQGPEKLNDEQKLKELIKQTPGYFSAQGDPWPAHCDDYCTLIGPTNWRELEPIIKHMQHDVKLTMDNNGLSYDDMVSELAREHSPLWAYLFKCKHCDSNRFVADYE